MQDTLLNDAVIDRFKPVTARPSSDWLAFNVPVGLLVEFARFLRDEQQYAMLVDVAGVDWNDQRPRFGVVYHFYSLVRHNYVRVVAECPDDAQPAVPSLTPLFAAADWHEREAYDMFGIVFEGHPDLTRILMWEGYPYYPLRKEFPLAGIETELPAADVREETGVDVIPAPMMGGPFHAPTKAGHMSRREPRAADQSWTESKPKPGHRG